MQGGYKQIKGTDGNVFSADNQPQNRGRKKLLFTQFFEAQKAAGVEPASRETVTKVIQLMLGMESPEIMAIAGDPKTANGYPFLMRLLAKELMGSNGLATLKEMLDRSNGRSTQPVEVAGKMEITNSLDLDSLTIEELKAFEALIIKAQPSSRDKPHGDAGTDA